VNNVDVNELETCFHQTLLDTLQLSVIFFLPGGSLFSVRSQGGLVVSIEVDERDNSLDVDDGGLLVMVVVKTFR